jgi:hypothetical protein
MKKPITLDDLVNDPGNDFILDDNGLDPKAEE